MFIFEERSTAKCVSIFESHSSEWCVCCEPVGPCFSRVCVCESCWCCETVLQCESDVLESSEPPAAAPTSACPS